MKNKMLLGVSALFLLSSLALGENLPVSQDVTVNIQLIDPITLDLSDSGLIDFGNVPTSTETTLNASEALTMSVSGAHANAEIAFYIGGVENIDADTVDVLLDGPGTDITTKLSLGNETVTADSDGNASTTISASILATDGITDNTAGNYTGTIKVYAEYN